MTRAVRAKALSTRKQCEELGKELGLSVVGYNPGCGTKVRVFEGEDRDYFDSHCIFATEGKYGDWGRCLIFLEGFKYGRSSVSIDPDLS